tara:strand:+ start:218 stop:919 length:702 start_codon:yes stop_codon:yes gene_type:complete
MKVSKTLETVSKISNLMLDNERLFFSRFGDGDINIMSGGKDMLHDYSNELSKELIESFSVDNERYLIGVAANYEKEEHMKPGLFAPFGYNDRLSKTVTQITSKKNFESAIPFHYAYVFHRNVFDRFIEDHIKGKRIMYIGCTNKDNMERVFGKIEFFVPTPSNNSYSCIEEWWPEIEKNIHSAEVVLPCSGMSSRVINKRLWNMDVNVKSLDIGSVVDAIDGKNTRRWISMSQ